MIACDGRKSCSYFTCQRDLSARARVCPPFAERAMELARHGGVASSGKRWKVRRTKLTEAERAVEAERDAISGFGENAPHNAYLEDTLLTGCANGSSRSWCVRLGMSRLCRSPARRFQCERHFSRFRVWDGLEHCPVRARCGLHVYRGFQRRCGHQWIYSACCGDGERDSVAPRDGVPEGGTGLRGGE